MIKDQRGFTLPEVLAVLVIISVILGVVIYIVRGTYASTMTQYDDINDAQIFNSARSYVIENNSFKNKDYACVTVKELIDYGYLSIDADASRIVKVTRDSNSKVIDQILFVDECEN